MPTSLAIASSRWNHDHGVNASRFPEASSWLLARIEDPDVNVRAANTFSLNDFISNGGILVAGLLVWWLGSNWPDLMIGVAVAAIAAWGGIGILRDAHGEHHKAVHRGGAET